MKTLLILALAFILLFALFITRPSQASFYDFYAQQAAGSKGAVLGAFEAGAAREYAKVAFTYNDRYLWVDVQHDGKTAFTGALSHWFVRDASAAKPGIP